MRTIQCGYCGQRVEIDALDDPPRFTEEPATDHHPRRFVIQGGRSQWLLHRCDISEEAEIDLREAAITGFETIETLTPA